MEQSLTEQKTINKLTLGYLGLNMLKKINSRKFQVWTVATAAFFMHLLPADAWQMISMLYMGVQGLIDWKSDDNSSSIDIRENKKKDS